MVRNSVLLAFVLLWAVLGHAQTDADTAVYDGLDSISVVTDQMEEDYSEETGPPLTKDDWGSVGDDTLATRTTTFDTTVINQLKADPELDYDRTLHVKMIWWERLKRKLGHWLDKLFGSKTGSMVFRNLHWAILAFAVIFLIFFLRKRLFHGVFTNEAGKARQVREIEEDIAQLDLDALLAKAEKKGDWRGALRYQYLKVLRRLMDEGRIEFQPKNTDRDYLRQLKEPTDRAVFSELSFIFKWAWYGDAPVDEARYRSLSPAFTQFHASTRTNA